MALNRIIGVAIKSKEDGKVNILEKPNRHHHVIKAMVESGYSKPIKGIQGFIDDQMNFLTREEAFELANKNGQYNRTDNCNLYKLFSEDLW